MSKTGTLPLILCAGLILAAADLHGQEDAAKEAQEKAKEHFFKGKLLVEEGAYEKAVVELEASYKLNPLPIVLYNIAWCHDELHQYADALDYYRLYLKKAEEATEEEKDKVEKRIEALSQFIGQLIVEVDVEGAEVLIDDKIAGTTPLGELTVDTGDHDIVVRKTGYMDIKRKITVVSGTTTRISIAMVEAAPAPAPAAGETGAGVPAQEPTGGRKKVHPAAFAATLTLAALSGAALTVTGALALKKNSEIRDMSPSDSGVEDARDERASLALATDILIGVAAASALTSIVLAFFTDWKRKERGLSLLPAPAPGGASLTLGLTF